MTPMQLEQWARDDVRVDIIVDPDLYRHNIGVLQGEDAVALVTEHAVSERQNVKSYRTKGTQRTIERYEPLAAGLWYAKNQTLDGREGTIPYAKPRTPRTGIEDGEIKTVKYEGGLGLPGEPLFARVPWKLGYQIAAKHGKQEEYVKRYYAEGLRQERQRGDLHRDISADLEAKAIDWGFWQWLLTTNIPVGITEGWKKSLALITQGIPAIALRGIYMWHPKGVKELYEHIAVFFRTEHGQRKRTAIIFFDEDTKKSTRKAVLAQGVQMGEVIEAIGGKPIYPTWEPSEGKGIDDVFYKLTNGQPSEPKPSKGFGQQQARKAAPQPDQTPQQWLDEHIELAPGLKTRQRRQRVEKKLQIIDKLNRLTYPITRETEGRYMPELPPVQKGAIDVVTAPMNSGKTYSLQKRKRAWVRAGGIVVVLNPLNSLGQQTAKDLKIPHIHDFETDRDSQTALWAMVADQGGIAMCPNSLGRLYGFEEKPLLLVLDEANQVVDHTVGGDTFGSRYGTLVEGFADLIRRALSNGAITLLEAGVTDRTVKLVQRLSGQENVAVRVFKHRKQGDEWNCMIHTKHLSGFRAKLFDAIMGGERQLVVTSGGPNSTAQLEDVVLRANTQQKRRQAEYLTHCASAAYRAGGRRGKVKRGAFGRQRPAALLTMFDPGLDTQGSTEQGVPSPVSADSAAQEPSQQKSLLVPQLPPEGRATQPSRQQRSLSRFFGEPELVVRVDGDTNEGGIFDELFKKPNDWLRKYRPRLLILSPSAKTGLSIEGDVSAEDAYFKAVWGYFPALATDTHMQLLGRYRPPVPRHIYVPIFIQQDGDEAMVYPRSIKRRLEANLKGFKGIFDLEDLTADEERSERRLAIENAVLDHLSESKAVSGAQKSIARDSLIHELEKAGHTVEIEECEKDQAITELWKDARERIWRRGATEFAELEIDSDLDLAWAFKQLESINASRLTRLKAQKVILRDEFLGVSFDDPEMCYQALYLDWGAMRRGVSLQAHAENLEAARQLDRAKVEPILSANVRAIHRLPRKFMRAKLIEVLGLLTMLDGESWTNSDPRAIAIKKKALHWAKEIYYWLRLQIKLDQSPTEIVNKLLRKLGLKAIAIGRPGRRGEQRDQVWAIEDADNPHRAALLEALRRKLSGAVSSICNRDGSTDQIDDTGGQKAAEPPPDVGFAVGDLVRWGTSMSAWEVIAFEDGLLRLQISGHPGIRTQKLMPIDQVRTA